MDIKLAPNEAFRVDGDIQKKNPQTGTYESIGTGGGSGGSSKYSFVTPEQVISTTDSANDTVSVAVSDRAMNKIALSSDVAYLNITFPPAVSGYMRDFYIRLVVTGSSAPSISFMESNGSAAAFDIDDDSWTQIEPGVNLILLSETEQ